MLQQTTVATVGNYYREFLALWPTVEPGRGPREDVLKGLGRAWLLCPRPQSPCLRQVVAGELAAGSPTPKRG